MLIRRCRAGVTVLAPAKVNLFLEVLHRRPDGYHELESLMLRVGLYDTLEIRDEPAGRLELGCDHPDLSCGADNLILRAAALLRQRTGHGTGARIRLWKRIPMQAGLAGGSSDAAATLAGLNVLWRLGLSRAELAALGAELGSDVAFFFAGPAAWCTGRGERIEPLALGGRLTLLLACPAAGLSTAEVYRRLTPPASPVPGDAVRRALAGGDVLALGRCLHNRLQEPAWDLCPEVAALHRRISALGPPGVLMSGSGTTVFALCRHRPEALRLARELASAREERAGLRVLWVRSCD